MDDDDEATMIPEQAYRAKPRGEWEYHPELMQPGQLLDLAKRRGVRVQRDERGVVVVCADCEGQITPLAPAPHRGRKRITAMSRAERAVAAAEQYAWGPTFVLDVGQLLADTVRHGVMFHDDALNKERKAG